MSIQQREQMEYEAGMMSEQQNAYAWGIISRKPDDIWKIDDLCAKGRFVVVARVTAYCPYTDAIAGSNLWYVSDHGTREDAETACAIQGADDDGEVETYVLPRKPVPPPPTREELAWMDDEIPF